MSAEGSASSVSHADGVDNVRALQRVLSRSAKHDPARRLHALYDLGRRRDAQRSADEALIVLHRVFDASPMNVAVTRIAPPDDGRFVLVNCAFAAVVGWAAADLLRMTLSDLTHPEDRARAYGVREELLAGKWPEDRVEIRLLRPDRTPVWGLLQRTIVRDVHRAPRFVFSHLEDLSERRAAEAKMAQQAHTDWLTRLPNRRLLQQRLHDALHRPQGQVGVLFIDLDVFKLVNDRYGHDAGDRALRLTGLRPSPTRRCVRRGCGE